MARQITASEVHSLLRNQQNSYKDFLDILSRSYDGKIKSLQEKLNNQELLIHSLKDELRTSKEKSDSMQMEIKFLKLRMKSQEEEVEPINGKVNYLEDLTRQNNIRFDGISDSPEENVEITENRVKKIIKEKLRIDRDIELSSVFRIGKFNKKSNKPRTIIAKFSKLKDRQEIIRRGKYLKGTQIYMNEDLSKNSFRSLEKTENISNLSDQERTKETCQEAINTTSQNSSTNSRRSSKRKSKKN